jgi:hypothetical protein
VERKEFLEESDGFLKRINLNQRVSADHPLRGIKLRVDQMLAKLSSLFGWSRLIPRSVQPRRELPESWPIRSPSL